MAYGGQLWHVLSRFLIFFVSFFVITHASKQVVQKEKGLDTQKLEYSQTITWYHVILFPVFGSFTLLLLFYFFDYIQFIFIILTLCLSGVAMCIFLVPFVHSSLWCFPDVVRKKPASQGDGGLCSSLSVDYLISGSVSVVLLILWVFTANWVLLDLFGIAISVLMLELIQVPSLKLSTVLLVFLLIYDVFWVFMSSSFFGANVMVEVAVREAKNPVAVVADSLNMPDVAQSQPSLPIPGKLIIPSSFSGDSYTLLGLGDIVLPGLLLCLAMKFDHFGHLSTMAPSSSTNGSGMKCLLFCRRHSYFQMSMCGYAIGMLVADLAVELMALPQPALLYLVPGVLVPMITKAFIQGDLSSLWHGPFSEKLPSRTILPT